MFFCNVQQRIIFSHNIFQNLSSKYLKSHHLKRHVMTLLHFKIYNYVQNTTNGFFRNIFSNYLESSCLFYKVKYSKLSGERCWICQEYVEYKQCTCPLCGALQKPKKDINYFELFGISEVFNIDIGELSRKFKFLQMTFHPDKFVNKSKEELEISESHSRLVNKAYTILKDPLARGFYLLELRKVPVNDSSPIDKEFLMSIMEKNEELECIDNKSILEQFLKKNNEEIEKQIHLISDNFCNGSYNEARLNLLKLNYFLNLEMKIKGKENDLLHPKKT